MPALPKDPREMLAAAAPLYNFKDPAMKPWHLKGTYQHFDLDGKPGAQGTYEYWWTSPMVYRSSWTRSGATRTEWHTDDGKAVYQATGERLFYIEHQLEELLFSPVPEMSKLDAASVEFERDQLQIGKIKFPCAKVKLRMHPDGKSPLHPGAPSGQYCFDSSAPVLRIERPFNSYFVEFDRLAKSQSKILAQEITITDGLHKLLTLEVGIPTSLPKDDPALNPSAGAESLKVEDLPAGSAQGMLVKKAFPVYPSQAKYARISGTVILDAMIGMDGRVKDIRVLSTPSGTLSGAAEDAVKQWQYSPYVVDGKPQEVNTIINVIFMLGG